MGPEHVNHFEREKVLPIAFSLFHYTNQEDANFMFITGQMPIWSDEWQSRVQMAINDHGKERTVDEMVHQRIGDFDVVARLDDQDPRAADTVDRRSGRRRFRPCRHAQDAA